VFDLLVKAAERGGLTFWSKLWFTLVFDLLVKAAERALNGMFLGSIAIYMLINVYNMYTLLLCATITQDNGFFESTYYLFMGS
jgi:hypothetical protein